MTNKLLRAAFRYARRSWAVLPLHNPLPGTSLEKWEQAEGDDPTQSAEAVAARVTADRLNILNEQAFQWIARGRKANIELGRVFNQIKAILEHGRWEAYFRENFAPRGIVLRTAQQYMQMAGEVDAVSKNANSALFPPATDLQAQAISDATHQAQAAVGIADRQSPKSQTEADRTKKTVRKERVRLHGIYRLPLFMSGEEKDATDALRKSEDWYHAEMEIMALVKRLHITYGIVNDSAIHDEIQSPPQVGERLENSPEVDQGDAYPEVATDAVYIRDAFEEAPEHGDALA